MFNIPVYYHDEEKFHHYKRLTTEYFENYFENSEANEEEGAKISAKAQALREDLENNRRSTKEVAA